jgi:hypothetical protein
MSSPIISLVVVLVGLAGAWLVGSVLMTRWNQMKDRRKRQLQTATKFYELYGRFIRIWKVWNTTLDDYRVNYYVTELKRAELLIEAAEIDGDVEATLLKVVTENILNKAERRILGQIREAFGVARYCIQQRRSIPYEYSEMAMYSRMKEYSAELSVILARPVQLKGALFWATVPTPTTEQVKVYWEEITSDKHEKNWKGLLKDP